MADRVRMKSNTVFNNRLIELHLAEGETRPDAQTAQIGDEFSTYADHADELERAGFAERIDGDASDPSEAAEALRGSQTSATTAAITSDGKAAATPPNKAAKTASNK